MEDPDWEGLSHHIRMEIGIERPAGPDGQIQTIKFTAVKSNSCPEHFEADDVCRLMTEASMLGGNVAIDLVLNQVQ